MYYILKHVCGKIKKKTGNWEGTRGYIYGISTIFLKHFPFFQKAFFSDVVPIRRTGVYTVTSFADSCFIALLFRIRRMKTFEPEKNCGATV